MNIDERIRDELERQNRLPEELQGDDAGLFGMLNRVFTGGLRRWAALAMAMTLAFVALTVWCGYAFFTAAGVDARVFWGILALGGFHAVSMFKLWFFMEMNRDSVMREVKRLEVAVARLDGQASER